MECHAHAKKYGEKRVVLGLCTYCICNIDNNDNDCFIECKDSYSNNESWPHQELRLSFWVTGIIILELDKAKLP